MGKAEGKNANWHGHVTAVTVAPSYRRQGLAKKLMGRGLHSFTSQLNLSAFYGIGCARRGCVARVKRVFKGV